MSDTVIEIAKEYKPLFDTDWREAAVYGGRGSLKSHTVARLLLIRARAAKTRIACFREFQNSIAESSHQLLADLISQYGLKEFRVTDNAIYNTLTESDFIFKGLHHNEQSIKSIEGIDIAWCFPAGTQIDGRPIESLAPGDYVRSYNHTNSAIEMRKVLRILKRPRPEKLFKLSAQHGSYSIIATGEHPVYVKDKGYTPIKDIKPGDIVYYEKTRPATIGTLFGWLRRHHTHRLPWETREIPEKRRSILLGLREGAGIGQDVNEEPNGQPNDPIKDATEAQGNKAQAKRTRWQWQGIYYAATNALQDARSRLVARVGRVDWRKQEGIWLPQSLQTGLSQHILPVGDRVRWISAPWSGIKGRRREKRGVLEGCRVDSVEVQEQDYIGQLGLSDGGDYVYNLEVEVNNNYFANGLLVHNCEEAQSISQKSLEILTPTIRKPGSQIIYTYNRLEEEDPVHKRLVLEGRPKTLVLNINYDVAMKHGWFPEVLRVEMEDDRERRPNLYKHKWLGEPNTLEGRIYQNWAIIDDIPHEAKLVRYGLDFGYSIDPTVIVAIYYYNGGYIVDEITYQKGLSNRSIADILQNKPKSMVIADSAEPKSIDEIYNYGINIQGVTKGPDSVRQGIQYVQEQQISLTSRSVKTRTAYVSYKWAVDKEGKQLNEPDDAVHEWSNPMDAIRYGFESLRPRKEHKERKRPPRLRMQV